MRLILLLTLMVLTPSVAAAAPVFTAIAAIVSSISAFAATSVFANFLVQMGLTIALSALARAVGGSQRGGRSGIATPYTMTGETNPEGFILGTYATAGQLIYPPLTHGGTSGSEYKTFVIALSALPGCQMQRVALGGKWATFSGVVDPDYGQEFGGKYAGYAWVKFYDGSQIVADPMLVAKYGANADYPWTADMVGGGICYAIVTLKASSNLFSGAPQLRFELRGVPLYDPRLDTTAGGIGAMRWRDRTTWLPTSNSATMIYNVLRGIDLGLGDIWGGRSEADDLSYATWSTAMDACDVLVTDSTGAPVAAYRAGFEVRLDQRPRAIIDELEKSCASVLSEVAARWIIRVGAPALPTGLLLDDDVVISRGREFRPTIGLSNTYNAVGASWVDPESIYQTRDAPMWENQSARQEDGNHKLVANVQLPAVTSLDQVARLQKSWLAEDRRWRTHSFDLPPRMVALEPFDVLIWTSERNGYASSPFEVASVIDDPVRMLQRVTLREINYADWQ